jgi:hypothetical protein
MRVGEYGIPIQFNTRFDLSGFTSLSLAFTKPDNTILTVTDPDVAIGVGDIITPIGTFLSGEYVTYTFVNGDVDLFGEWSARLTANDGSENLISAEATFTVEE